MLILSQEYNVLSLIISNAIFSTDEIVVIYLFAKSPFLVII